MASRPTHKIPEAPRSLSNVHVDVLNRLGAVAPTTTTGLPSVDAVLGGGLRSGTFLLVSGAPGVGKTSLAVMLAYIAARARASVLLTSVGLDDTEMVARLTARTLHREYHNVTASYGTIWSGRAMQDPELRGPISGCLESVVKKVGDNLHFFAAAPMDDIGTLGDHAGYLWAKNERVVVVVDGVESFTAAGCGPTVSYDARMSSVAYELARIAAQGCAVVATCNIATAALIEPAATVFGELRTSSSGAPIDPERALSAARHAELEIVKNRLGAGATVPLLFLAAASVFEERS